MSYSSIQKNADDQVGANGILKILVDFGTFVSTVPKSKNRMVLRFNNGQNDIAKQFHRYETIVDDNIVSLDCPDGNGANDADSITTGANAIVSGGTWQHVCKELCVNKDDNTCASQTFDPLYYEDDISYVDISHGSFTFNQNKVIGIQQTGGGTGTIQMNNKRLYTTLKKYGKNIFKVSGSSTVVTMDGNYAPSKAAGIYIDSGWTLEISNGAKLIIQNGKTDDWRGNGGGTGK